MLSAFKAGQAYRQDPSLILDTTPAGSTWLAGVWKNAAAETLYEFQDDGQTVSISIRNPDKMTLKGKFLRSKDDRVLEGSVDIAIRLDRTLRWSETLDAKLILDSTFPDSRLKLRISDFPQLFGNTGRPTRRQIDSIDLEKTTAGQ
jgi:hypothetical protein